MTDTARLRQLCLEAIEDDDPSGVMACLMLLRGRSSRPPPAEALSLANELEVLWKARQSPAETHGEHDPFNAHCRRCEGLCRFAQEPYDTQPPSDRPTIPQDVWEEVQP